MPRRGEIGKAIAKGAAVAGTASVKSKRKNKNINTENSRKIKNQDENIEQENKSKLNRKNKSISKPSISFNFMHTTPLKKFSDISKPENIEMLQDEMNFYGIKGAEYVDFNIDSDGSKRNYVFTYNREYELTNLGEEYLESINTNEEFNPEKSININNKDYIIKKEPDYSYEYKIFAQIIKGFNDVSSEENLKLNQDMLDFYAVRGWKYCGMFVDTDGFKRALIFVFTREHKLNKSQKKMIDFHDYEFTQQKKTQ